ncbi:MAG: DHA2 family efflux MFS transporter permease subunit [Deltaproteobacteria bacterium]|nr:DHA2 family efflux MFS transporter permease subunit [Deltaproteobacteria bacterium]
MAEPSLSSSSSHAASANRWLIALAVMMAAVMEVLDMTIANVALDHIRGSLSAGVDEAAWVLSSYIVANAVVLPLTGWLGKYFGRKRFFVFCVVSFTVSSLLCGAAPNLSSLIVFRVLQGACGGALMPMSQAILLETFPPREHAKAMAIWGLGMMLGPILGPILGGWITDNYSWRWIFYINAPFGLLAFFLVSTILEDPPYVKRAIQRIDWWGLSYLVLGIGCMQIVLDKGEREDWFSSDLIVALASISVVSLCLFVWQELRTKEPIVDLHVFNNRTFTVGTIFTTVVMFALYGTMVLTPLYCQLLAGYTPLLAGKVLAFQYIGTFTSLLLAGRLFHRVDPRALVFLGCWCAGYGAWDMTYFNPQSDYWAIAWPGLFRGLGSGLIFMPLSTLSLSAVPKEQMGTASGLFNMVRTIGGGVGIAMLLTFLSRGAQVHQSYLGEQVHLYNPAVWKQLTVLGSTPPWVAGEGGIGHASLTALYGEVQRQALLMAFVDDFRIVAYLFFFLSPVVFLMRRPRQPGSAPAGH